MRYFKYSVHISGAFLQPETLAGALYLLTMRLAVRDYVAAFALIGSVSSDTEMTPEEDQIFRQLTKLESGHPDFHAVRVGLLLALADSPAVIRWDVRQEMASYLSKLSHINVRCRLSREEEAQALVLCNKEKKKLELVRDQMSAHDEDTLAGFSAVLKAEEKVVRNADGSIDEADHEEGLADDLALLEEQAKQLNAFVGQLRKQCERRGMPATDEELKHRFTFLRKRKSRVELRLERHEKLLPNYEAVLQAVSKLAPADKQPAVDVPLISSPPGGKDTCGWFTNENYRAFAKDASLGSGELFHPTHMQPTMLTSQALTIAVRIVETQMNIDGVSDENCATNDSGGGFIHLYELLTNQKAIIFKDKDPRHAHTFASLLCGFTRGIDGHGLRNSILNALIRNPWTARSMPVYDDTRTDKTFRLRYTGDVKSENDPLSKLMRTAHNVIVTLHEKGYLIKRLPPGGFTSPVVLPMDGPVDLTKLEQPLERLENPVDQGDASPPALRSPSSLAQLHRGMTPPLALQIVDYTESSGRKTISWKSGLKGLSERSNEVVKSSDYRLKSLDLSTVNLDDLAINADELRSLLGPTLSKVSEEFVAWHDGAQDGTRGIDANNVPDAPGPENEPLPELLMRHPDAIGSPLSTNALKRLNVDMKAHKTRSKITPRLAGLEQLYGPEGLMALDIVEEKLQVLREQLILAKREDEIFTSRAYRVVHVLSNRVDVNSTQPQADASTTGGGGVQADDGEAQADNQVATEEANEVASEVERSLGGIFGLRSNSELQLSVAGAVKQIDSRTRFAIALERSGQLQRIRHRLLRVSGHECYVWFELMVGCLMSQSAAADLHQLNRYVSMERWKQLLNVLAIALLRSNRIKQINTCIEGVDDCVKVIASLRRNAASPELDAQCADGLDELRLKLSTMCAFLTAKREYATEATVVRRDPTWILEPRFLAFEFVRQRGLKPRSFAHV